MRAADHKHIWAPGTLWQRIIRPGVFAAAGLRVPVVQSLTMGRPEFVIGSLHERKGLKRHAVSLFEAGRVSGAEVVAELIRELWASYEAGQVRLPVVPRRGWAGLNATLAQALRRVGGSGLRGSLGRRAAPSARRPPQRAVRAPFNPPIRGLLDTIF
jgi:hypothetical protein